MVDLILNFKTKLTIMKKLLLVVATMIATLQTFSQTDLIRQKLDSIFQYIDKALIPTGYLNEYGPEKQLIPNSHLLTYVNAAPL